MAEPRIDPPHPGQAEPPRPTASADEPAPSSREVDSADALDDNVAPTDDAPTIISKNPRPAPADVPVSTAPDAAVNNDLRGRHLAHFELLEQIGVGGMAAVLRARDTQLDRFVALKILPPDMALDAENVRRFHQEARSAAKLDHENIARVFFCGEDQRLHFIAFEFVEGVNLRTLIEQRGRLPITEALPYLIQVTAGLSHAAQRSVVHRDIKPSNIIITPNGRAKLVDMGLARSLGPQHDNGLTHSGVTLGTFDYISPEQALEPRDADVRSDIYSLGCTFYHMVTGRPPVPEGTAARKLHHHQHVKPTDPRELVPGLPDDVAVILDRMMAKDPGDRYQSADDLLRHLLLVARKLGATADVPEGVLFVEAALPSPPGRGRPLLLGALAVVAVVTLIFFLDLTGSTPDQPHSSLPPNRRAEDSKEKTRQAPDEGLKKEKGSDPLPANPTTSPIPRPVALFDEEDLAQLPGWLQKNNDADEITIILKGDLDLSPEQGSVPSPGLVVKARKKVTILAAENRPVRPTVRLSREGLATWTALTIDSPQAEVRGLRIEINARLSDAKITGLLLKGGQKKHQIQDCEFVQALPGSNQLASLVIEGKNSVPCDVQLSHCLFLSYATADQGQQWQLGQASSFQEAVVCRGPTQITADQCAFGPHGNIFHWQDSGGQLTLDHCSVLAGAKTAVFELEGKAEPTLVVRRCLFSRPAGTDEEAESGGQTALSAVVVRQLGEEGTTPVRYTGQNNRYHNFTAFWVNGANIDDIIKFDNHFASRLEALDRGTDTSRILEASPWKDKDPLRQLGQQNLVPAFRVNEALADLRVTRSGKHLIGVEKVQGISYLLGLPLLDPPEAVARKGRIVDPMKDDSANGIYPNLEQAILAAQPGDVILIRANNLRVESLRLEKPGIDLTIRAERGFRPILTLADSTDPEAALFRLHDGKLHLEDLEFRLQPQKSFKTQTVVALLGDGQCFFKSCLATLDQANQATALSLVTLYSQEGQMKMEPSPSASGPRSPRVELVNCFVRGQGDLVCCRANRPFDLNASNVLAALSGSFLNVETGSEALAALPGQAVKANLSHVTTYLGGQLLFWRAGKDVKSLVPIGFEPSNCAFLPQAGSGALIRLDGLEADADKFKEKVSCSNPGANLCGNYTNLFDPQVGEMMNDTLTLRRWQNFTGSMDSNTRVKLNSNLPPDIPLTRLLPSLFKLQDQPDFGADLAELLKLFPAEEEH